MTVELELEALEALEAPPARPDTGAWTRSGQLVDVRFPSRTIELVVIPYDTPALVGWEDRMVRETIARGAFDGIERRANRVRLNRDHENDRVIGRAVAFHPSRDAGLVGEFKVANTDLGTESLELAADGILDASAGFRPMGDGLRWDSPSAYTITKAWLAHVALTPDPAHPDAKVIAVRAAAVVREPSSTPLLDEHRARVAAERLAALAASLDGAVAHYQP